MLRVAEHFSDSDVGRQRQGNEDSYFARSPLFVVADGMGGAQAGEVASDMAVRSFESGLPGDDPARGLSELVRSANRRIHERSRSDRQSAGMGTTLTAAYLSASDEVVVAHVGDSRCYLLRDGDLSRLTRDHSLVGELVARGKLTEEQAEHHPQRSVITRALGPEPEVEVDVDVVAGRAGDVFLVCSDGLTSMLGESEIKAILERPAALERRGRELIAAANRAGGRDNITVILFRLEQPDAPAGSAARRGAATAGLGPASASASAETSEVPALAEPDRDPSADPRAAGSSAGGDANRSPGKVAERSTVDGAPRRRRRRTGLRILGVFVLLVLPVIIALWVASRVVYFIGSDPERNRVVTIYRGVPYELPGGVRLYERFYTSGVTLQSVPESRREIFTDHQLRSRDDAEDLVIALERDELNR